MGKPNESEAGTVIVSRRLKPGQSLNLGGIVVKFVDLKGAKALLELTVPSALVASGALIDLDDLRAPGN